MAGHAYTTIAMVGRYFDQSTLADTRSPVFCWSDVGLLPPNILGQLRVISLPIRALNHQPLCEQTSNALRDERYCDLASVPCTVIDVDNYLCSLSNEPVDQACYRGKIWTKVAGEGCWWVVDWIWTRNGKEQQCGDEEHQIRRLCNNRFQSPNVELEQTPNVSSLTSCGFWRAIGIHSWWMIFHEALLDTLSLVVRWGCCCARTRTGL